MMNEEKIKSLKPGRETDLIIPARNLPGRIAVEIFPGVEMKLGDIVKWQSQANGSTKVKVGKIVAVVPAGQNAVAPVGYSTKNLGFGGPRNHESYLVAAGKLIYWPRVSKLVNMTEIVSA